MANDLYMATTKGVSIARLEDGNWQISGQALSETSVTSIVACEGLILAGTTKGIWRSSGHGKTWERADSNLEIRHLRWLECSPRGKDLSFVLAGTEPAGIFFTRDGADTWVMCPEVGQLRDDNGWYLPYSPGAGCVRGFAVADSSSKAARVYAAVEVGGVLVSHDNGETWQLVEGSDGDPDMARQLGTMIHPDVHSITVHPSSPDLVTAATGGGLYRSTDAGRTWCCLYYCYCRATWVDPADPRHIIFGPADGVSRNGRLEESRDGGQTWHPASAGMKVPWPRHMVERFVQLDHDLLAVLSNGELWLTRLDSIQWQRVLTDAGHVTALAAGS